MRKPKEIEERVRIARGQPHRRTLKSNDRISELAESALGRLSLRTMITAGEHAAGEAFAAVTGRYRSSIEGPRAVRSLSLGAVSDTAPADGEEEVVERFACPTEGVDPIERKVAIGSQTVVVRVWPCGLSAAGCQCAHRRERYMRAYDAIAGVGRRALMAVIRIAVRGEEPGSAQELVYLKAGLSAAARHFGLTELDRGR